MLSREPIPVDETETIDPEQFVLEYVERHRPLILRGAIADWPAMGWDDRRLRELLAAYPLRVDIVPHDEEGRLLLSAATREDMGVDAFIDALRVGGDAHHYIHDLNLPLPLHPDVPSHPLSSTLPTPRRLTWWWGRDQQLSGLHYDDNENFMCQLRGHKEFLLFDAADFAKLYALPGDFSSAIDLERSRPEDFPGFVDAQPYFARIGPGDLLYVPCYWWHRVRSTGEHMAISHIINETMAQRVRVAGRLIEADNLDIDAAHRQALLEIVALDARPGRRNAQLKAYHRDYLAEHGRSYYPHQIFHRLIEESLAQILRGHASY